MKIFLQLIKNLIIGNYPDVLSDDVLSQSQLTRIKNIQRQLREVEKNTLRTWVGNFKKDSNPDSEIAIWECIAETYSGFICGKSLNKKQKSEIFTYSLSCSFTHDLSRLESEEPKYITKAWIKDITTRFKKIENERIQHRNSD